jgi:hypothetical protein
MGMERTQRRSRSSQQVLIELLDRAASGKYGRQVLGTGHSTSKADAFSIITSWGALARSRRCSP